MDFLPEVAFCRLCLWHLWSSKKTVCFSIAPPPSVKIVRWIVSNGLFEIHLRRKARSRKLVMGTRFACPRSHSHRLRGRVQQPLSPLCLGCGRLAPILFVGRIKRCWLFAALGGCRVIFCSAIHHLLPGTYNIPRIYHISVNNL